MALENLTPVTRPESILNGDDIEPVTRGEYFLKKAASGGLPEYTSADKNKVLTVGEGESETVVVVPEQTITSDGSSPVPLSGTNTDYFESAQAGDTITLLLNNEEYVLTARESYIPEIEADFLYQSTDGDIIELLYLTSPSEGLNAGVYFISRSALVGSVVISGTASVRSAELIWKSVAPPELPADNGTYYLKIVGGVASWVLTVG